MTKKKKEKVTEVTEVSSTDDETIWDKLCEEGKKRLSNGNSAIWRALSAEQPASYPPEFNMSDHDCKFIEYIRNHQRYKKVYGIEEVLTLLGIDEHQRASTRRSSGRGKHNWIHSATTDKYLGLLARRSTQGNTHIIPELIRKRTTVHGIRHTPYAHAKIHQNNRKASIAKTILAILSVDSHTFVCRDTQNELQFFTARGPTVQRSNGPTVHDLCDLYMDYMRYNDTERNERRTNSSLMTMETQKDGDCAVWALQFVNCLSTNRDLTALLSASERVDTAILRYFMLCEILWRKALTWPTCIEGFDFTYNFDRVKDCKNLRGDDELQKACFASKGVPGEEKSTPMMHDEGTLLQAFKTSGVKWTQDHCGRIKPDNSEFQKACFAHIASQKADAGGVVNDTVIPLQAVNGDIRGPVKRVADRNPNYKHIASQEADAGGAVQTIQTMSHSTEEPLAQVEPPPTLQALKWSAVTEGLQDGEQDWFLKLGDIELMSTDQYRHAHAYARRLGYVDHQGQIIEPPAKPVTCTNLGGGRNGKDCSVCLETRGVQDPGACCPTCQQWLCLTCFQMLPNAPKLCPICRYPYRRQDAMPPSQAPRLSTTPLKLKWPVMEADAGDHPGPPTKPPEGIVNGTIWLDRPGPRSAGPLQAQQESHTFKAVIDSEVGGAKPPEFVNAGIRAYGPGKRPKFGFVEGVAAMPPSQDPQVSTTGVKPVTEADAVVNDTVMLGHTGVEAHGVTPPYTGHTGSTVLQDTAPLPAPSWWQMWGGWWGGTNP
jgi:hypothetical protein